MSIFGAMNAGVSGLNAQSQAMGMIADNIANVNTVGYKGVSARFSTLVTTSPTRTFHTPGGVRSNRFHSIDQQGLLQSSSSKTDLAVAGQGMFVVRQDATSTVGNEFLFTRDGSFIADKDGNLMTSTGNMFLQGLVIDDTGSVPTTAFANLTTVNIAGLSITARPTTMMEMAANLPADDPVGQVYQITIPLFDGQGSQQSIDYFWAKTATNTWALSAVVPNANTNFATDDTTGATLASSFLIDETNFTFSSVTGNFFGGVLTGANDITATKTNSNQVQVSVGVGTETFQATFAIPNALTDVTNFTYTAATTTTPGATVPAINGAYTGASAAVTPGAPHSIAITIGGTVYTATVPQVAGNDVTGTTVLNFVNGNDTLTLDLTGASSYDLDVPGPGAGTEAQFEADLDAALAGLTYSSGAIVDGVADLAPAGTLTLTASGGQTMVLNVPAGGASYDYSDDTSLAALDTNLTAALSGAVLTSNGLGVRMADIGFDPSGRLSTVTSVGPYSSVNGNNELEFYVDFDGLASTDVTQDRTQIALNLGTFGALDGMKQFAGDFFVAQTSQNGVRFGNFSGIEISEGGIVTALFDNGERNDIYQLALALFNNPNGLEARSGNAFQDTDFSGTAQLLLPTTAGAGAIAASALETSTVDIAEEFTRMIVTQRAYSASARIITTADEMLEELLRIRR